VLKNFQATTPQNDVVQAKIVKRNNIIVSVNSKNICTWLQHRVYLVAFKILTTLFIGLKLDCHLQHFLEFGDHLQFWTVTVIDL